MANFCNCIGGPNCCMLRGEHLPSDFEVRQPTLETIPITLAARCIGRLQPLIYLENYDEPKRGDEDMRC